MNADAVKVLPGRYCNSLTEYSRFVTREVHIGDVPMGGNNPIRIQSMTTTDTMDTEGTVEQSIRMIHAGCEYVRITAPSIKEAQILAEIKKQLRARGYTAPLVADIHFTPNAAEVAAMEADLAEAGGLRVVLQRQARTELAAEGTPVTRATVTRRAHALLLAYPVDETAAAAC